MRRFIIGTLLLFATLLLAFFMEGGNPLDFFLPSPLIITLCVPCFAVLAVWSLADWGKAWRDAFSKAASGSAPRSAKLWDFYEKACYIAGAVGLVLGLNIIFMDQSLHGDRERFLRSLSIDSIAPILAIFLAIAARILKARVEESGRGG